MSQPNDQSQQRSQSQPEAREDDSQNLKNSETPNSSRNSQGGEENPSQGDDMPWLIDVTNDPRYPQAIGITGMSMPKKRSDRSAERSTDIPEEMEQDNPKENRD
jgi:hypothetical protein